jgi:hypothetical protein
MWDYSVVWARIPSHDLLIQAQHRSLSKDALAFLTNQFRAELVTHGWPGDTQYRFFNGDQRILIWADPDEADWFLTADNEESLAQLVKSVSPVAALGEALWSHRPQGEALLSKIRQE